MYNYNNNTSASSQQQGIDIPYNNSNRQNVFYGDPFALYYNGSFELTSTSVEQHGHQFINNATYMMPQPPLPLPQEQQLMMSDPMADLNFMAFLSLFSTSEPILMPSLTPPTPINTSNNKKKRHTNKKTGGSSTRIGQCEHPKHVLYRQEKYTTTSDETTCILLKTIPRRGRPPKGSKSTEFLFSTSPIISSSLPQQHHYPMVELTVRPLPKRLEAVVGKSNIKVCLTCLKRSDTDQEYLTNKLYTGPQQMYKKKKMKQ